MTKSKIVRDLSGTRLINTQGEIIEIGDNLSEFCRNYSLCYASTLCLLRGKYRHHKGWVLFRDGMTVEDVKRIILRKTHHEGVKLVSASGDVLEIETTLKAFCKQHGLCYNSMNDVVCRRRNNYKGIRLLGVDVINGRALAGPGLRQKFSKGLNKFIQEAREKHGDKYDYSLVEYVNTKTKVRIVCPVHGEFQQAPSGHLSTGGCKKCWFKRGAEERRDTTESFIKKATEQHNGRYDYSKILYKSTSTKVSIICSLHGEFQQRPNRHLQGDGCPTCAELNKGWDKGGWIRSLSNKGKSTATLYVVNLSDERENFYKVGITGVSVDYRFRPSAGVPYKHTVVTTIEDVPSRIWDLEKHILTTYHKFKYLPLRPFAGDTECFTTEMINNLSI